MRCLRSVEPYVSSVAIVGFRTQPPLKRTHLLATRSLELALDFSVASKAPMLCPTPVVLRLESTLCWDKLAADMVKSLINYLPHDQLWRENQLLQFAVQEDNLQRTAMRITSQGQRIL